MPCELTACPPFAPNIGLYIDCLSAAVDKTNCVPRATIEEVVTAIGGKLRPLGDQLSSTDERSALAWFYTSLQRDLLESRHDADSTFRPLLGLAKTLHGIRLYLRCVWWEDNDGLATSNSATFLLDPYTFKFKEAGVQLVGGKLDHLKDDEALAFLCSSFPHHVPVFDGVNGLALGFLPKQLGPVESEDDLENLTASLLAMRVESGVDFAVIGELLGRLSLHVCRVVPKGEFKATCVASLTLACGEQPRMTSTGIAPLNLLINRFGLLRNIPLHLETTHDVN